MKADDTAGGVRRGSFARVIVAARAVMASVIVLLAIARAVLVIAAASRLGRFIRCAAPGGIMRGELWIGGWRGGGALVGVQDFGAHQFSGDRLGFRTMRSGPGAALGGREATTMLPALFGRTASTAMLLAREGARIAADGWRGERNPSRDSEIRTQRSDSNQMPPGGESQYVSLVQTHRTPLANGANGSTLIVCRY